MLTLALAALLSADPSPGTAPPASELAPLSAAQRTVLDARLAALGEPGAHWAIEDRLGASGLAWKAHFDPRGVGFTPALGAQVERSQSVRLEFEALTIDGRPQQLGDLAAPRSAVGSDSSAARVTRDAQGAAEHWEAREQGLELWWEIHELPSRGELSIAYAVDSSLPLAQTDGAQVEYRHAGGGGVRISGVVGVDAEGRQVEGAVYPTATGVEFVLPASFVERASLPLVLDPVIGPIWDLSLFNDFFAPQVAYDSAQDTYLVVFESEFSATDTDLLAWRRTSDGSPLGPLVAIASTDLVEHEAAVGANQSAGDFAIVWAQPNEFGDHDLWGRKLDASSGALNQALLAFGGAWDTRDPVLTDEVPGLSDDTDLLIGFAVGDDLWRGIYRHGDSVGAQVTSLWPLSSDGAHLSVSREGGPFGRHLFGWTDTSSGPEDFLAGALVRRDGSLLTASPELGIQLAGDQNWPSVVGDGTEFWIAHRDTFLGGEQILARRMLWTGSELTLTFAGAYVGQGSLLTGSPSAVLIGDQLVVFFTASGVFSSGVAYTSLDQATMSTCEPPTTLPGTSTGQGFPAAATAGSTGLVCWSELDAATQLWDLKFQQFRAVTEGGHQTLLGGGEFGGGTPQVPCAYVGNADFEVTLTGAVAATQAFLIVGQGEFLLPCGDASLRVDPFSSVVYSVAQEVPGAAKSVPLSIPDEPSIAGIELVVQWFIPTVDSSCTLFGGLLSNALRFSIQ